MCSESSDSTSESEIFRKKSRKYSKRKFKKKKKEIIPSSEINSESGTQSESESEINSESKESNSKSESKSEESSSESEREQPISKSETQSESESQSQSEEQSSNFDNGDEKSESGEESEGESEEESSKEESNTESELEEKTSENDESNSSDQETNKYYLSQKNNLSDPNRFHYFSKEDFIFYKPHNDDSDSDYVPTNPQRKSNKKKKYQKGSKNKNTDQKKKKTKKNKNKNKNKNKKKSNKKWSYEEIELLKKAHSVVDPFCINFWEKVAEFVPNRTVEECSTKMFNEFSMDTLNNRKRDKPQTVDLRQLAGKGTLKRRRQMREILKQAEKKKKSDIFLERPEKVETEVAFCGMGSSGTEEFEINWDVGKTLLKEEESEESSDSDHVFKKIDQEQLDGLIRKMKKQQNSREHKRLIKEKRLKKKKKAKKKHILADIKKKIIHSQNIRSQFTKMTKQVRQIVNDLKKNDQKENLLQSDQDEYYWTDDESEDPDQFHPINGQPSYILNESKIDN
ncbi:putative finger ccch domain protein [Anaeramoeba flamelloides]|uniref:Finger ccch domain protein n=1 Tax=Anaeramoeba flamelloides TaxID=1746091 RepID=A0AAV7Y7Y9_9EUKA|nr:putative finger ccch domain protein [Anaeramoeba flamelloides]